ncbi:MAG: Flp pilus assembly complex ATPase component TadA, partial [Alcaligenaceae bacterium]|nr:Flp pilus assembly complex ATPase component TadA [Alcaligenaceae bacterium]
MSRLLLSLQYEDGANEQKWFELPITIGKQAENSLELKSWRVSKHHAKIFHKEGNLYLHDLGSLGGSVLNSQRIYHVHPLDINDQIVIGPCLIRVVDINSTSDVNEESNELVEELDQSTVNYSSLTEALNAADESDDVVETTDSDALSLSFIDKKLDPSTLIAKRNQLHKLLLEALDLKRNNITMMDDSLLREEASRLLKKIVESDSEFSELSYADELCAMVLDEAVGLGPLEELLKDPSITEIMVNRFDEIYIERAGKLEAYPMSFSSNQSVVSIIDRIVAPIGRRIDESSPMVDARLKDGSRVNAVLPPIAIKGANITIRKFPLKRPDMRDL